MTVVTRFPPSPTGMLHVGGARTALFNWLYARRHGGSFVLRIEDTDRERSTQEAVDVILEGMAWLGLDWDEGPHYQTQRFDRYREVVQQLLDEGKAYRCYSSKEEVDAMREAARERGEKPRYNGYWRERSATPPAGIEPVIRFKNPLEGDVVINDQLHGEVRFSNTELDDLVIARADGTPTYHLTVVVDDMDMGITHVIRGDDHLNNTPRQINLLEAIGAPRPVYCHVPMILGHDGKRLSKRHGAVSVLEYREAGILPEALLNYLARLGWSHGDQEVFSIAEMVELFDLDALNKSAAGFDPDKLLWLNQHYIKETPADRLADIAAPFFERQGADLTAGPPLTAMVDAQRERAKTLIDMAEQSLFFYQDFTGFDEKAAKKHLRPVALEPLSAVREALAALPEWNGEALHGAVAAVSEKLELNMGKVAQPLRVAVTGAAASPGIDVTLELVGRERSLARIDQALEYIRKRAENA
ncbi:MAG: glutamate--tRNA ligase [Gammaproteobacteria bacterium]|nr:glutamate--tRNA ligase [Gammaproteobacteria bacterium]